VDEKQMQLSTIVKALEHLSVHQKRSANEEFVELVFYNRDLEQWQKIISLLLGAPRKVKGQEPTPTDLELTAHTGGIRLEQTLFEKKIENGTIIAKFWPWQDNTHTTLRMALLRN
jgi:hypothetical protein